MKDPSRVAVFSFSECCQVNGFDHSQDYWHIENCCGWHRCTFGSARIVFLAYALFSCPYLVRSRLRRSDTFSVNLSVRMPDCCLSGLTISTSLRKDGRAESILSGTFAPCTKLVLWCHRQKFLWCVCVCVCLCATFSFPTLKWCVPKDQHRMQSRNKIVWLLQGVQLYLV